MKNKRVYQTSIVLGLPSEFANLVTGCGLLLVLEALFK